MSSAGKPVALVTGGSRGIGRAVCLQLAAQGATVGINYVSNAAAAEEVLADGDNLNRDEVAESGDDALFAGVELDAAEREEAEGKLPDGADAERTDVLVLDTMGELARAYGMGDVCFVGGSLVNKGGHNIIEAAVHGRPVVFGPSLFNNEEISARLLELRGGEMHQIRDGVMQ